MDSKIHAFPNDASRASLRRLLTGESDAPVLTAPTRPPKLGLYPLGAEDVVISKPLYDLILTGLEQASAADRALIAEMMRKAYDAPFAAL